VDLWNSRGTRNINRTNNCKFPGHKIGCGKSGEKFKNRIEPGFIRFYGW
jgi:hypothetical protein